MSSYQNGLNVGDLVYAEYNIFSLAKKKLNLLVLDRTFLFSKDTRYGLREFYNYSVYCLENNMHFKASTQELKVIKIIKG